MVMRTQNERPDTYEIYDSRGEAIGRVVEPVDPRVVGRTSGTVLLVRELALRSTR
jgi:hypothetical protein